jgi:hypothetical protein
MSREIVLLPNIVMRFDSYQCRLLAQTASSPQRSGGSGSREQRTGLPGFAERALWHIGQQLADQSGLMPTNCTTLPQFPMSLPNMTLALSECMALDCVERD